jgi:DNA-binding MarR family transcriptional regulator
MLSAKTDEKEILFLLHALNRSLFAPELGELTFVQLEAIRLVKLCGSVEMGQLAKELTITPASASTLATRLVKAGWLERVPDELDRRIIRLIVSEETKQRLTKIITHKCKRLKEALSTLPPQEQTHLKNILTSLKNQINQLD